MVLGGLAQLALVAIIAVGIGAVVGFGLSRLSGDDAHVAPAVKPPLTPTQTAPPSARSVDVQVLDAVLHPASSASGQRRRRARLSVRIRAENQGRSAVTPARPVLIVGEVRTRTDSNADSPRTSMGSLEPGAIVTVALRFEVAGDVTTRLTDARRARIRVAGRSRNITVKLGEPAA